MRFPILSGLEIDFFGKNQKTKHGRPIQQFNSSQIPSMGVR